MALLENFIGPTYNLKYDFIDGQRAINMYVDVSEYDKKMFFLHTPGLKKILEEPAIIRALYIDSKNDFYAVAGHEFIKYTYIAQDDVTEKRVIGNLITSEGDVGIADNGFQICIVDGDYIYNYVYADDTFANYEPDGWLGSNNVIYVDKYFVFYKINSQQFYISNVYDGRVINALDFASKENFPDNIVQIASFKNFLWLFGSRSIQLWYNSGAEDFAFSTQSGGDAQVGCIAPNSVVNAGDSLIWLGSDDTGFGTVYATTGSVSPTRISNFAIENFLQNQETIEDASAYAYQDKGHTFYVLNLPSAQTTLVYDLTTQMWHERQFFPDNSQPERHRAEKHVVWRKKHIVSDYKNGKIYEMSLDIFDDDGYNIRRVRRSPHTYTDDKKRLFFSDFTLDLNVGDDIDNAKIFLRFSDDGGKTWSNYLERKLPNKGNYTKTVVWRRLGSGRDRVWEVSLTDKVSFVLRAAYVN